MDDRQALNGIFYVLCTGCQWNALPRCLGASSTVHDRFQEWQANGTLSRFWQAGLMEYVQTQGVLVVQKSPETPVKKGFLSRQQF